MEDGRQGKIEIATSAFTLAEVIKDKGQPILPEAQEEMIAAYFEHEYIIIQNVDRLVAEDARRLARLHNLRPPDAVHLASAVRVKADVFQSWNGHFLKITDPPIPIEEPPWEGQPELPMETGTT